MKGRAYAAKPSGIKISAEWFALPDTDSNYYHML